MRIAWICALLAALTACTNDIQNKEAVRQGVIDHLKARKNLDLDMSAMQVDVSSVTFRENEADATVSFVPKGGSPSQGMTMKYTLERAGSGWKVKQKAEATNSPHSDGGAAPPTGEMPPGHPPIGAGK
jgi:hypothetical protein